MQELKLAAARVVCGANPVFFMRKFFDPNYVWTVECVSAVLEAGGCSPLDYDEVMVMVIERYLPEAWLYKIISIEEDEEDRETLVDFYTARSDADEDLKKSEAKHGKCFRVRRRPIDDNLKRDFTFMMKKIYKNNNT